MLIAPCYLHERTPSHLSGESAYNWTHICSSLWGRTCRRANRNTCLHPDSGPCCSTCTAPSHWTSNKKICIFHHHRGKQMGFNSGNHSMNKPDSPLHMSLRHCCTQSFPQIHWIQCRGLRQTLGKKKKPHTFMLNVYSIGYTWSNVLLVSMSKYIIHKYYNMNMAGEIS